jgi:hypothetical protein
LQHECNFLAQIMTKQTITLIHAGSHYYLVVQVCRTDRTEVYYTIFLIFTLVIELNRATAQLM